MVGASNPISALASLTLQGSWSKWLETSQSYSPVRQSFSNLNSPLNYPH